MTLKTYNGGIVDRALLEEALDFFISLEVDEEDEENLNSYEENLASAGPLVEIAETVIKNFGLQITPLTLPSMQEVYYSFTNSDKYRVNAVTLSVVTSILNSGWHGIGDWRA